MVVTSESPTFMLQVATITPVIVPVKPLMITLQPGTQEPGHLWIAGGDFNQNLSKDVPFPGHWSVPNQGTFRQSVTKPWINPIDGFVLSPALQHGAECACSP